MQNLGTSTAGILRVDVGKMVDQLRLERGVNLREFRSQIVLLGDVFAEVEEGEIGVLQFGDKGVPIRGVLSPDFAP